MGPDDYIETVLTCKGDYYDPEFPRHLERFSESLRQLIKTEKQRIIIKKVEPWNSVRVTFNIPKEAAQRLRLLAEQGNPTLQEIGVLAVQIEGDRVISLTIAGKNNERTELVLRTSDGPQASHGALLDSASNSPSKALGALFGPSGGIMDTLGLTMPETNIGSNIFRPPGSVAASPLPGSMQQPLMMPDRNGPMPGPSYNQGRPGMLHGPGPDLTSPGYSQSPPGSSPQFASPMGQSPSPGPFQSQTSPPPYSGLGINNLNNKSVFNKALNQAAPGLLVNLLQHEGTAAQNNGQPQKMPPPEGATPQKRRRRRQKDKTANGGADKVKAPPRQSKIQPADKEAFIMHLDDIMHDVVGDEDNERDSPKATAESPFISSVSHSYSNSPVDSPASSINTRASTDSMMENASVPPGKDETRTTSPMDTTVKLENHIKEETGSTSQDTPPYDNTMKLKSEQPSVARIKRDSEHDEQYHPAPANCIINPYTGQLEPRITEAMSDSDHCDSDRRRHDSGPARTSPRKSLSPIRSTDTAAPGAHRNVLGPSTSTSNPDTDSRLTDAHGEGKRRSPAVSAAEAASLTPTVPSPSSQNPVATNSALQHIPRSPGHHGEPMTNPQSPRISNPGFVNTSTLWRATNASSMVQVTMMGGQARHGVPVHSMAQRGPYPGAHVQGMPAGHNPHMPGPGPQPVYPHMRMGVPYSQTGPPVHHGYPQMAHRGPPPQPGVVSPQPHVTHSRAGTPPSSQPGPVHNLPLSKPGTPPTSQAPRPASEEGLGAPLQRVGPPPGAPHPQAVSQTQTSVPPDAGASAAQACVAGSHVPLSQPGAALAPPPYSTQQRPMAPSSIAQQQGPPMVRMVQSQYGMARPAPPYSGAHRMAQPPVMYRATRPPPRPPVLGPRPVNPHQPELRVRPPALTGDNGPVDEYKPAPTIAASDAQPEPGEHEPSLAKTPPNPHPTSMASRSPRATPIDSKPADLNGPKYEPVVNHVGERSPEPLTPKETAKQQLLEKVPNAGLQNFHDHSVTVIYALADTSNGEMNPKQLARTGSAQSLDSIRVKLDNSVPKSEEEDSSSSSGSRTLNATDIKSETCKPSDASVTQGTESGKVEATSTSPRSTPAPSAEVPTHAPPVNGPVRSPGSARQSSPRSPRAERQSPEKTQPVHPSEAAQSDSKSKAVKRGAKLSDICAKLAVQNDVKLSKSGPSPKSEQDKRARSPAVQKSSPKDETPSTRANSPRAKPAPDLAFFNSPLNRLTAPIFPFNLTQSVKKVVGPIPSSDPVKLKPSSPRSGSPRGNKDSSPPVLHQAVSAIRLPQATPVSAAARLASSLETSAAAVTMKTTDATSHANPVTNTVVTASKCSDGEKDLATFGQLGRVQDCPDGRKATYDRKLKTTNIQVNQQTVKACSPGNSVVSVVVQNADRQNDESCPAGLLDHAYVQRTVLSEPLDLAKTRSVTVNRRIPYDNGDVNCEHVETPLNLTSAKTEPGHKVQVNGPKEPNGPSETAESRHKSPVQDSRLDTESKDSDTDRTEKRSLRAQKRNKPDDEAVLELPLSNKRKRRLTDDSASSGKTNSIDYLSEDEGRDDLVAERRRTLDRRSTRHSSRSNSRGSEITEEHDDHTKVQTRSSSKIETRRGSDDSIEGVKKSQEVKRLESDPGRAGRPPRNSPVREMPDKRATRSSKPKDGSTPAATEGFSQPPLLTTNTSKRRRFSRDQQR